MDRRKKAFYILSLSACIIFYLIFALVDGPVICVDSQSYISMDITREPLYPAFLALLRMVPGATADFAGIPAYLYLAHSMGLCHMASRQNRRRDLCGNCLQV